MKLKPLIFIIILISIAGCSEKEEPVKEEEGKIIVLMYHRIVNGQATNLYERSVDDFEGDLRYLQQNKINVISFNDLGSIITAGKMPQGNSAIITFDDGDHSWYTLVKPLLLEYKMNATFFLWTNMIGQNSFIQWNEVEEMSHYYTREGQRLFVFGSHTWSHTYLLQRKSEFSTMTEYIAFLDYELGESKKLIESHTPGQVITLSLPYGDGFEDPDIIAAAQRNGYKFVRTSKWGAISNPSLNLFAIPSLPILDSTTADEIGFYLGI